MNQEHWVTLGKATNKDKQVLPHGGIVPTPRFEHDCTECRYLGYTEKADLYWCPQGGYPTVIARYSSDPPDYSSGLAFVGSIPDITEAAARARVKGLLVTD